MDAIIPALKENRTLKELDLSDSKGLTGEGVGAALIDLLQSRTSKLTKIHLESALLKLHPDNTGIRRLQGRVDEELRKNSEDQARLLAKQTCISRFCSGDPFDYAGQPLF